MKLKLVKKHNEAKDTKSFFWEPEKAVSYRPGQYLYFTLPELGYPDARGATRHFTISSSPTEGPTLRLTTRIRKESGYKRTLDELQIGASVEGEGPNGTFILNDNDAGPHIFLAGGIGITPFRCFVKYAIDKELKIPMYLIYSNSKENEITYKEELEDWAKTYDFFKISQVITGRDGHLDTGKINNSIENWSLDFDHITLWVVGPPAFVSAMEEIAEKLRISSANLRSEKFTGY